MSTRLLLRHLQRCSSILAPKSSNISSLRALSAASLCRNSNKDDYTTEEIELRLSDTNQLNVNSFWLRDHCMCDACYNHKTNQRKVTPFAIAKSWLTFGKASPTRAINITATDVRITWCDGHKSVYTMSQLERLFGKKDPGQSNKIEPVSWDAAIIKEFERHTRIPHSQRGMKYPENTEGFCKFATSLITYGFAVVTETPIPSTNPSGPTQQLCEHLAGYHPTFYENFWVFNNKQVHHADTAYSSEALGAHNDSTYYEQAPGIQVFHSLQPAEEGGETLLVDGLHVARTLRSDDVAAFRFLCDTPIAHRAIEPNVYAESTQLAVIRWNHFKNRLIQFRYNPYDRSPLLLNKDNWDWTNPTVGRFYRHYTALSNVIERPENEFWFKLEPGMVLFVNNWRVMHGRSAFKGFRELAGCYLFKEDLLSKARNLGLY